MSCGTFYLALVLFLLIPLGSLCADRDRPDADVRFLRDLGVEPQGPELLAYLRKRSLGSETLQRAERLIRQLGSDDFAERQQASSELVILGPAVRPLLRTALEDPDLEIQHRAERCLQQIEKQGSPTVLLAVLRMVGRIRPPGAETVLLDLAPFLDQETLIDEVGNVLATLALREGEPAPEVAAGLRSREGLKRALAAEALCRAGGAARALGRPLLEDPDPRVRRRVALTLLEQREKPAVPVLIGLLTALPRYDAGVVEDRLRQVAGEESPEGDLDGDAGARTRYREAWQAWWSKHESALDLTALDLEGRSLGYTLIAELDLNTRQGAVYELDRRGKERWRIGGLVYPIDVQVIGNRRVLICDYRAGQVRELSFAGEVLWQKTVPGLPLAAQRLPSGQTFIATRNQLLVVDAAGKETWSCRPPSPIITARRLSSGLTVALTTRGTLIRLDRAGKVRKETPVCAVHPVGLSMHLLPNGHVVLPLYNRNRVVELDTEGKEVWGATVRRPFCVQRLKDGSTLVSSRLSLNVVEINRQGAIVHTHSCDGWPLYVHRR